MKKTGPINTLSVYMNNRNPESNDVSKSIVNMNDPYWQEYYERNFRAQDKYKLPSEYAWDYKEDGFLGELIDIKKCQRDIEMM